MVLGELMGRKLETLLIAGSIALGAFSAYSAIKPTSKLSGKSPIENLGIVIGLGEYCAKTPSCDKIDYYSQLIDAQREALPSIGGGLLSIMMLAGAIGSHYKRIVRQSLAEAQKPVDYQLANATRHGLDFPKQD